MSDLDVPTTDPADVRAEADRILQLPEFRDDRNPIERAIDWVVDRLGDLIPDGGVGAGPGAHQWPPKVTKIPVSRFHAQTRGLWSLG